MAVLLLRVVLLVLTTALQLLPPPPLSVLQCAFFYGATSLPLRIWPPALTPHLPAAPQHPAHAARALRPGLDLHLQRIHPDCGALCCAVLRCACCAVL